MIRLTRCVLCMLVCLLSACALSPQIAQLNPNITVADNAPIVNTTAKVQVIDQRSNAQVGSRGGVYANTSHIRTAPNLIPVMQKKIERAFREIGVTITDSDPTYRVQVALQQLTYRVEPSTWYKVALSAALKVTVSRAKAQYIGQYHGQTTNQSVLPLSADKNTILLTKTLNAALNQILNDKKLVQFLQMH